MNRMTPAKRVKSVHRGEKPDCIPFTVYESKIIGKPYEDDLRKRDICFLRRVVSWQVETPNVNHFTQTEKMPNGQLRHRSILETPYGNLSTAYEAAGQIGIDTTWKVERLFKNPDDYKRLKFYFNDMVIREHYAAISADARVDSENGQVIVRDTIGLEPMQELIADIMGTEAFCFEWMDNRDEMEQLLEIMAEKALARAKIVAGSPLWMANYGGNVMPQIIGRDSFINHYMARYADAYEILHHNGKLMGVHFDGVNTPIMDLIANCQIDYVEAYDPSMSPSVAIAMQTFGDKVLSINWPSADQLNARERIVAITRAIISQVTDPRRFIIGITEDIPVWKFAENVNAIADAIETYGYWS